MGGMRDAAKDERRHAQKKHEPAQQRNPTRAVNDVQKRPGNHRPTKRDAMRCVKADDDDGLPLANVIS